MFGETWGEAPDVAEHLRVSWTPVPERRRGVKLQMGGGHMVQLFRDGTYKDEAFPVAEWVQSEYWCDQIFHNIGWLPAYKPYLDNADRDRYLDKGISKAGIGGTVRIGGPVRRVAGPGTAGATVTGS